jgi:hypothetical protein
MAIRTTEALNKRAHSENLSTPLLETSPVTTFRRIFLQRKTSIILLFDRAYSRVGGLIPQYRFLSCPEFSHNQPG